MDIAQFAPETVILAEDEASLYLQATTTAVWAPLGQTPTVRAHPGRDKVNFYGTLNWRTNLEIGDAMISFWARNFLNKEYAAFYFETMNKGFMQKGRPMQFGVDLRCRF